MEQNNAQPTAPEQPPQNKIDTSQIYPVATQYLDPNQPKPKEIEHFSREDLHRLPIGVYIIAGLVILSSIIAIVSISSSVVSGKAASKNIYLAANYIDILLALGLILKINLIRKILIFFAILSIFGSIFSFFGYRTVQNYVHSYQAKTQEELKKIEDKSKTGSLSLREQQLVKDLKNQVDDAAVDIDEKYARVYAVLAISIAINFALAFYLSTKNVKEKFR